MKDLNTIAEIQVSYSTAEDKPKIKGSEDTATLFRSHWNVETLELLEECKLLLLNRANEVLGIYPLSKGGITGTVVDIRIVLSVALKANAVGIIIAHNHPSGNLTPSIADKELTKRLKEGAKLIDINLLDHLILTKESYYSMSDEGAL